MIRHRDLLIAAALFLAPAHSLRSQETSAAIPSPDTAKTATRKSPAIATALGIFPGGGHFYSGEKGRGAMALGAFVAGLAIGSYDQDVEWVCEPLGPECGWDESAADSRRFTVGMVLVCASMFYSIVDARFAARRANRRNGLQPPRQSIAPYVVPARSGATSLGVSLRGTW